jgi:PAS domain S-box-containing protein
MRGERWPDARDLLTALLVAVACGAGARVGTAVRFPSTGTAFLFLPYAVLAAALILSPPRRWWLYLLAAGAGDLGPHLSGGAPLSFVVLAELANWSRALVAAIGMRRFIAANDRLDTLLSMSIFLLIAGLLAPLVGAILGAATVALHHGLDHYVPAFRAWLVSNGITGLTVLPVILLGAINIRIRLGRRDQFGAPTPVSPLRVLEATALLLTLLVVGGAVLLGPSTMGSRLPVIIYAPLSLLLWSAVRFGPLGTSASVLLLTVLSIVGIARGYGPFANESPALDLIHLQMFLFTRSVPLLLLAALIQQQRSTAHALRANQEQHRAVIEDQTEPICRFQPDGTLTFVNGAGGRTLGQRPEALVGQNFWSLMPPGAREAHAEVLTGLRPEQPVATWEQERVSTAGERRWEQWRVRALFDENRRTVDFQALGLDLTERKRVEQERQQLQAQQAAGAVLREADRRKDEFLAMLAHELRNPLAPISMVAEVLRELPDADETVCWAREVIARQATHLTRLVDDLLDMSRITSGTIHLQMETLELNRIITGVIETSRPLIASRGLTLTQSLPPDPVSLRGDGVRLAQVVSNLLNNAAKYSEPGGTIDVDVRREEADIVIRVTDQGAGIPADMLERVFDPFTQVDGPRDGSLGGLGLGLSLVQRLVRNHGGTVQAHSAGPGCGSQFSIHLPALGPPAEAGLDDDAVAPALATRALGGQPKPPRVLVVDDALDAADTLARFLRLHGCKVEVAHDGVAGLDTAMRLGPDIVFLDLSLPRMDGLEVARQLRRRFKTDRMLLVATTGFGQDADRHRTAQAGFDHHLTKPADPAMVRALLSDRAR